MPNCTCYAWGRFWELSGTRPTLSTSDAENWYNHSDGYERGQTPKLGAVICWSKGSIGDDSDGSGHVAIVEQINSDGSIVTSNSAWKSTNFYMKDIPNTYEVSGYTFLGFIYNPVEFTTALTPVSGNRYLSESEMQINATYVFNFLTSKGWSLNAIAGILGNMEKESTINPAVWQNLNEGNTSGGFGLTQWTPATKLINWCNNNGYDYTDIDAQLNRIIWELENGEQYYKTDSYPLSFSEFTKSTDTPENLAYAFMYNYERPEDYNQPERKEYARKWYNYFINYTPSEPDTPPSSGVIHKHSMSLLMMYMATKGL